jgi:hypothetical protein
MQRPQLELRREIFRVERITEPDPPPRRQHKVHALLPA